MTGSRAKVMQAPRNCQSWGKLFWAYLYQPMQTTKQLILVRHAKSDWDDFSVSDHDRVLNERGRRDAPVMGQRILKQYGAPDLILSSTALRAKQTAQAIQAACLLPEEAIQFHSKLYHAGPQMITDHILETPDAVQRLLIVCHNPGITFFANSLCGSITDNIPTCGVVVFEIQTQEWSQFAMAGKKFIDFDYPKKGLE